jgi:large subunit ribosomal protein L4
MKKVKVYNQEGLEVKEISLEPAIFDITIKPELIAQVVTALEANKRQTYAHTKGRSEVRGGGRKPWKQKGTGRARHGSIRSPLWIGGGVTFGPTKERNFSLKINKKVKIKTFLMALSDRAKTSQIIVFDKLELPAIKTKALVKIFNIPLLADKKVLLVIPRQNKNIERSARNLSNIEVVPLTRLGLLDVLRFPCLVCTEETLKELAVKYKKQI